MRKGELVLIFLPNKFERFSAGLRNYIQRASSDGGPTARQRKILRKLHLAASMIVDEEETPVNIFKYFEEILRAVQIIKIESEKHFNFKISAKETFLMKKHILDSLLLTLCKENDYLRIVSSKNGVAIFSKKAKDKSISLLATKLNGCVLTEIKCGMAVIFLKACRTTKKGVLPQDEIELLDDPYSIVNLYINEC